MSNIPPYILPYAGMAEFWTHDVLERELQKSIESLKESNETAHLPSLIDEEIQKYTNKFRLYQKENRLKAMQKSTNTIQALLDQLRAYKDMPYEEVRNLIQTIRQRMNSGEPNTFAIQELVPLIDKHFRSERDELYMSAHFLMDCLINHMEEYIIDNNRNIVEWGRRR